MSRTTRGAYTEESAEVEVLLANVDKLKLLTKKIQASLERLDASGKNVQDALRPIRGDSSKLQITSRNIDRINEVIEKRKQPIDRRRREDTTIHHDVRSVKSGNYVPSFDGTHQPYDEMPRPSPHSNQESANDFTEPLRITSRDVQQPNTYPNQAIPNDFAEPLRVNSRDPSAEFRDVLQAISEPLQPLHYITKQLPFPAIPVEQAAKLRSITEQADPGRCASIYTEIRGIYLRETLHTLALASNTTAKKTDPNAIYRKGTSGIGTYCLCIEGLFLTEYENMPAIFTPEQCRSLPSRYSQEALADFGDTMRKLSSHIGPRMPTDCFLAYEIIEVVSALALRLDARGLDLREQIEDHLRPVFEIAKRSLRVLLETTRLNLQSVTTLPSDASALPLTGETLTRLQTLTDYPTSVPAILAALGGESGWRTSMAAPMQVNLSGSANHDVIIPPIPDPRTRSLLSIYIADMLDASLKPLESLARRALPSKSAQGAFLLNTVALLDRGIASSPDLVGFISDNARKTLDAVRKKGIDIFLSDWSSVIKVIQQPRAISVKNIPGQPVDSAAIVKAMQSKERKAMEETFAGLSRDFDTLVSRYRQLRLEREVKVLISTDLQKTIVIFYNQFWDRYHEVDKGKGKSVKYDKVALENLLASLAN